MNRFYCTYFDRHYLCKALAMVESLIRSDPAHVKVMVVCMDEISRIILKKLNLPQIIPIPMHDIESRDVQLLQAKATRTTIEYYWTATPTIILRLLERHPEIDVLTYLDADLFFFASPQSLFDELAAGSVLIHEHRFSPELAYLEQDNGRFNVGLVSFRNNDQGLEILRWWRERCNEWCYRRCEDGKMGDQMYLNQWPERFDNIVVVKSAGAGVAPWNHGRYEFNVDSTGRVRVDDWPLIFYHFHSYRYLGPECFAPHFVHYGLNHEALRLCFIAYQQSLASWYRRVTSIMNAFSFGIEGAADLEKDDLMACMKGEGTQSSKSKAINDQWNLVEFDGEQDPEKSHRPSHPTSSAVLPADVLVWPVDKPVSGPNDLLLALRGRDICAHIHVLYIVGAHKFEEESLFTQLLPCLERVVLIEPIAHLADELSQRYASSENIIVLPYAVADVDGSVPFHMTNNLESSSLLPMGYHLELFPEVQKTQTIKVDCRRLDTIIAQHRLPSPDMLFIDAQGAELKILHAIPPHRRKSIKLIYTEASTQELYQGSGTLDDIRQELAATFMFAGYAPTHNEVPIHGNALFVHRDLQDQLQSETVSSSSDTSTPGASLAGDDGLALDPVFQQEMTKANQRFIDSPNEPDAIVQLGRQFNQLGRFKEAAVFFRLALKEAAMNAGARRSLMDLIPRLVEAGDKTTSRDCCLTLLSDTPDDVEALGLWEMLKDCPEAKKIVEIRRCVSKTYRVAAIVSTYQSEAFIGECLSNLEAQSIADQIEIVVLDAASPENERRIVTEQQKKYDNITYIRTKGRIGVYTAWNLAIKHASAPYCISVSTNDQLRQDACGLMADALDEGNDTMLVFGDTYLTHHAHETFERNRHYAAYRWPDYTFRQHLAEGCCIGPHPMWRRAIHEKIGFFDERFIADGDQEFWMRLGSKYSVRHLSEFTGLQWITPESLSGKGDTPLLEVAYIQSKYRQWQSEQGHKQARDDQSLSAQGSHSGAM